MAIKNTSILYMAYTFIITIILFCSCKEKKVNSINTNNSTAVAFSENKDSLSTQEISLLQNGDIIMRQGRGTFSLAISANLNEEHSISHCGILKVDGDSIYIIHTLSSAVSKTEGMQTGSLQDFIDDSYQNTLIVSRFKNNNNNKIVQKAEYYLEKKVPFDNDLSLSDSTKMFCSELIFRILDNEYNTNLIGEEPYTTESIHFAKLMDTTKFEIIINHQKTNNNENKTIKN